MLRYLKNIISIIRVDREEKRADKRNSIHFTPSPEAEKYAAEIKKNGYCIISNFMTAEECAIIRTEIDRLLAEHPDKMDVDPEGSDHRIWGAERASVQIKNFHTHKLLAEIAATYTHTTMVNHMTLAARMEFKKENKGSGGGWHRDSSYEQQFKAIIYLSDVQKENGPYQYLEGTHRLKSVIRSFNYEKGKRFGPDDLDRFVKKYSIAVNTVTGNAGTLILTDTRGIHRGMPIESGVRYALTNYYVGTHRQDRFADHFNSLIKF